MRRQAGDREGLQILHEPAPMIELLERLSITRTDVPGFAFAGGHDAVFGFLAWPYVDTAKILAEEISAHGEGLPPKAAAAVAALIAEEHIMNGTLSSPARRQRLDQRRRGDSRDELREVAGAEGAIAGSTTAARRRASGPRSAAPSGRRLRRPPRARSTRDAIAAPAASVAADPLAAAAPVAAAVAAAPRHAERIAVHCPACRAGNSPQPRASRAGSACRAAAWL